MPLLFGGMALAVSFMLMGLWLARGSWRRLKIGAGLMLGMAILFGLGGCLGEQNPWSSNAGTDEVPPLILQIDGSLTGKALLETTDSITEVKLQINPDQIISLPAPTEEKTK